MYTIAIYKYGICELDFAHPRMLLLNLVVAAVITVRSRRICRFMQFSIVFFFSPADQGDKQAGSSRPPLLQEPRFGMGAAPYRKRLSVRIT